MALCRISSPENNQIRAIFHFAERSTRFAPQLDGYFTGAVSKRGMVVDHPTEAFSQRPRLLLSLAGQIAKAIDQRVICANKVISSSLDGRFKCGRLSVDERRRIVIFRGMVGKPGCPQAASLFGLNNTIAFGVQLDIIADATTERTYRIGNDSHRVILLQLNN
jgi:hypothetical protein